MNIMSERSTCIINLPGPVAHVVPPEASPTSRRRGGGKEKRSGKPGQRKFYLWKCSSKLTCNRGKFTINWKTAPPRNKVYTFSSSIYLFIYNFFFYLRLQVAKERDVTNGQTFNAVLPKDRYASKYRRCYVRMCVFVALSWLYFVLLCFTGRSGREVSFTFSRQQITI